MTVNPRQSFRLKLCVWVSIVALVVFGAIFGICIYSAQTAMRKDVKDLATSKLNIAADSFEDRLLATEISAENLLNIYQSNLIDHDEAAIYDFFQHFLEANPHIQGVAIGYEPGVIAGHDKPFSPYIMNDDGKYIRKDIYSIRDFRKSHWYKDTKTSGKANWTYAFVETNGTIVTSYCVPIRDKNGEINSVAAFDLNLSDVSHDLQSLKPYPNALLTVIDGTGTFVAHPDTNYIMKETFESAGKKMNYTPNEQIINDIHQHKEGAGIFEYNGKKYVLFYKPMKETGWMVTLEVPVSDMTTGLDKVLSSMLITMVIGIILLIVVCFVAITRLVKPLETFATAARKISEGDFNVDLPAVIDHNELFDLRAALASMKVSIDHHVAQLEASAKKQATIDGELNIARSIQLAMVPSTFPPFPDRKNIDVYGTLIPAKAVGGDLYDYVLDGDDLYFCIGDVSGKGVPASLVMAITRALFRNIVLHAKSTAEIAQSLNEAISENNEENMFVTMFIGHCNLATGEFSCCNCGHNAPVTNGIPSKDGIIRPGVKPHFMQFVPTNIPIGVMSGFEFEEAKMTITHGTKILLYTDGVTEAENINQELFGDNQLLKNVAENTKNSSAQDVIEHVMDALNQFTQEADQSDDITMLCFQYLGEDDQAAETLQLKISNKVEEMNKLLPFIQKVSAAFGIPSELEFNINLVLDEALANSVSYAYGDQEGDITLTAAKEGDDLVFTRIDNGKPFDPTEKGNDVDTTLSAEEREIGGLGIFLIKQMMDEISYRREDDCNILVMKKNLKNNNDGNQN